MGVSFITYAVLSIIYAHALIVHVCSFAYGEIKLPFGNTNAIENCQ